MFCLTVPKEIVQESFSVSLIRVSKILGIRGVGHDILSKTFCLTVPKKIGEESFRVSFNFGYRKNLCIRGVYYDILSEIFCLTVPRNILQESLSVSLIRVLKILA